MKIKLEMKQSNGELIWYWYPSVSSAIVGFFKHLWYFTLKDLFTK